jgi:hypothetical protein
MVGIIMPHHRNATWGSPMRTTIDIPEREHALYTRLARAQRMSLSKLLLELAKRGLESVNRVAEIPPECPVDPQTGLGVFRSSQPVTMDVVKAFEEGNLLASEAS